MKSSSKEAPDVAIITPEMTTEAPHPTPNEIALAQRNRAQRGIVRKIERVFQLHRADNAIPEALRQQCGATIQQSLQKEGWYKTRNVAIEKSDAGSSAAAELDTIAARTIHQYLNAFYLRYLLCVKSADHLPLPAYSALFGATMPRKRLLDAYINHIGNAAELELQQAGLDAKSAHITHGNMIGQAISIADAQLPGSVFGVSSVHPLQGPVVNKETNSLANDRAINDRIQELRGYWERQATALKKDLDTHRTLQHGIAQQEKEAGAVRRKIQQVYGLSDNAMTLGKNRRMHREIDIHCYINDPSGSWEPIRNVAMRQASMRAERGPSIDAAAEHIMLSLIDALEVHRKVMHRGARHIPTRYQPMYLTPEVRRELADSYVNHRIIQSALALEDLGLPPQSILPTLCTLVAEAQELHQNSFLFKPKETYRMPALDPEHSPKQQLHDITLHGRAATERLSQHPLLH